MSVTDRCNLRCRYCMPEEEYVWLPKASLLTFEELATLAEAFAALGVAKVRITGGEPLLRHDLPSLVALLAGVGGLGDLALTTNGLLLARHADALRRSGLQRITVSLDTLRPDRFAAYARSAKLHAVLEGLDAAAAAGFTGTKINSVITRGVNDDEIVDLFEFAAGRGAEVRFIEYMDVGGATSWTPEQVVSRDEILGVFRAAYGELEPLPEVDAAAPADRFRVPDGRVFGVIASTTAPFCGTCDRARLTADGVLFLCLYGDTGIDLRGPLRSGATAADLANLVREVWSARTDRGAEARLAEPDRGILYQIAGLRSKPHREMHTRGG